MTYTWQPSGDYLDHSNVARLMRTLGVATADELRARSVADETERRGVSGCSWESSNTPWTPRGG